MKPLCIALLALFSVAAALGAETTRVTDEFTDGLGRWRIEQQPGGSVTLRDGALVIDDAAGCTVWLAEPLEAPVTIRYEARVSSASRVSDLNCFWMASDPRRPDLLAAGHDRDGRFGTYDGLQTYYVGYGGNNNTTTRFRRYDGTGARPLDPRHEKLTQEFLLQPNHSYRIELTVARDGHVEFRRDGETIFTFDDPTPLLRGWFGFRTVHSRIEIRHFSITASAPTKSATPPRVPAAP